MEANCMDVSDVRFAFLCNQKSADRSLLSRNRLQAFRNRTVRNSVRLCVDAYRLSSFSLRLYFNHHSPRRRSFSCSSGSFSSFSSLVADKGMRKKTAAPLYTDAMLIRVDGS